MSLELYFLLENEGGGKPLGNPKWKKGHNFPLFIGSRVGRVCGRFLHWAGKTGSQLDDHKNMDYGRAEKNGHNFALNMYDFHTRF